MEGLKVPSCEFHHSASCQAGLGYPGSLVKTKVKALALPPDRHRSEFWLYTIQLFGGGKCLLLSGH